MKRLILAALALLTLASPIAAQVQQPPAQASGVTSTAAASTAPFAAGRYYLLGRDPVSGGATYNNNKVRFGTPFYVASPIMVGGLAARITGSAAGASIQMGLYRVGTSGRAEVEVCSTGNVAATSNVNVYGACSVGNVQLTSGWYVPAFNTNDFNVSLLGNSSAGASSAALYGASSLANINTASQSQMILEVSRPFGTWGTMVGASFSEVFGLDNGPVFWLYVVSAS